MPAFAYVLAVWKLLSEKNDDRHGQALLLASGVLKATPSTPLKWHFKPLSTLKSIVDGLNLTAAESVRSLTFSS